MQDRYAGDVGDFGKLALLRGIMDESKGQLKIGIQWYYVPNESHNKDGKHISYLGHQNNYRNCDEALFDELKGLISNSNRTIHQLESLKAVSGITFFNSKLSCYVEKYSKGKRTEIRAEWLESAFDTLKEMNIIYFDPDNGFEVPSVVNKEKKKASKYIYYDEVERYVNDKKSVIIYQHLFRAC
ncbi:hypothetical protein VQ056_23005 [Paenibacillus sp. JTLBN-2024]